MPRILQGGRSNLKKKKKNEEVLYPIGQQNSMYSLSHVFLQDQKKLQFTLASRVTIKVKTQDRFQGPRKLWGLTLLLFLLPISDGMF